VLAITRTVEFRNVIELDHAIKLRHWRSM
jgi:hypothetical protein